ncbi:MAG: hypothetical protein JRH19_15855, partial [Deltaproteobacteria bacterium]|nr:hypothetical protein [Deltaproteobacteria bacterium]
MTRLSARLLVLGLALPLLSGPLDAGAESGAPRDEEAARWHRWSATFIGQYKNMPSPVDDDDVGGWFDQYEFTPNKSSSFPFEIGIRDGDFDLFEGDDTPIFQARLESPTSNLGISGSQIDQPFFNQRLDVITRLEGIDVDLFYRRIRSEQLRIFPDTQGPGLVFQDSTGADDRFYRDRTGFWGELRARPYEALGAPQARGSWLAPELSLRGGYDRRDGLYQLRVHRDPSNEWLGPPLEQDRSVSDVGGGLLVAPGGLLTLTFDFDYEQLRFASPMLTEGDLGYPPPNSSRTVGFVPNSDRSTGTIRFNSRIGGRAVIEGGFQIGQLEQARELTPNQDFAGLVDNRVRYYGANAALDLQVVRNLSVNAIFKYDRRDNDIQRDTALFNQANGSQIDPFLDHWQRFLVGGELELRLPRLGRAGLGVRYEDVSRDLEFALPGGRRILSENSQIDRDSKIVSLYGRAVARPWRRFRLDAELGYRWAPETGYAAELDDNLYGRIRASYVFLLPRALALSAYVRGGRGENDDFTMVSGQGPNPSGALLPRSYERSNVVAGITASFAPSDPLSLYASFFYGQDNRDTSLDLSTLQRYWQDHLSIDFSKSGLNRFENQQMSFIL